MEDLKRICGYRGGLGSSSEFVVENLNVELRNRKCSKFRAIEKNGPSNDHKLLSDVINNQSASYPIITVGPDFLRDYGGVEGEFSMDHVMIVVYADEEVVWFFDPYKPFAEKKARMNNLKDYLSYSSMLQYWNDSMDIRHVLWIERAVGSLDQWVDI